MRRCGEYPCHFLPAEDQKKSLLLAWKGNVLQQKCPLPSLPIEETQCANDLVIALPRQLLFLNQEQLVLTNVLRSELIGRAMKMLGECGDVQEVQSNGSRGVVSPLELFQHALAKLGHAKRLLSVMTQFTLLNDLWFFCRKAASFNGIFQQPEPT